MKDTPPANRKLIYFLADNHYGARPGAALNEVLQSRYRISFHENDVSCLSAPGFANDCELLILNLIAETSAMKPAGEDEEQGLRSYLERGKPLLLLHGGSAAFWRWAWWRSLVGYRWVRPNDPDGAQASFHPVRPYKVTVSKTRHPLSKQLQDVDIPEDEIYVRLEQTCPTTVLLETNIDEGTFPQCWENATPWGGRVIGLLPGHRSEVVKNQTLVANVTQLIDSLLEPVGSCNGS